VDLSQLVKTSLFDIKEKEGRNSLLNVLPVSSHLHVLKLAFRAFSLRMLFRPILPASGYNYTHCNIVSLYIRNYMVFHMLMR
jgi:hypothetical protein